MEPFDDFEAVDLDALDPKVADILDSLTYFIGQNTPTAGKEKAAAVRKLRAVLETGHAPSAATIEAFAVREGKSAKVAKGLRRIYEGLEAGKTFLDYNRRPI